MDQVNHADSRAASDFFNTLLVAFGVIGFVLIFAPWGYDEDKAS